MEGQDSAPPITAERQDPRAKTSGLEGLGSAQSEYGVQMECYPAQYSASHGQHKGSNEPLLWTRSEPDRSMNITTNRQTCVPVAEVVSVEPPVWVRLEDC